MNYRIWYSTESFADFIIAKTELKNKSFVKNKLYESDANNAKNFHTMPEHIKKILYLDAPDLIVELISANGFEPIFSIEESKEAGTGHNAFQRFARLAASVENNVPAFYIYPEAVIIERDDSKKVNRIKTWDKINPLVFKAMDEVMSIYKIPALLFYFPTYFRSYPDPYKSPKQIQKGRKNDATAKYASCPDSTDAQMVELFTIINETIVEVEKYGAIDGRQRLLSNLTIRAKRTWMHHEYVSKNGNLNWSPLSSTILIDTKKLIEYLTKFSGKAHPVGELLNSRKQTLIYCIDAGFRGDPYPGALAAIDYLMCRTGKTFEDRKHNLVLCFGKVDDYSKSLKISDNPKTKSSTIQDFIKDVKSSEKKNLLTKEYHEIKKGEIPRYFMQVRYGSTYSKVKHVRVFAYFADAILFPDGALWRDA
jgi:hypothetical protein